MMPVELPTMDARIQDEITRVRRVYRGYAERGRCVREWAADRPGNRAIVDERTRFLAGLLERSGRLPLGSRRVLDLGCGDGEVLAGLVHWGALPARLIGVDVRADAVARANARWPQLRFEVADATVLPYRDASFDLVLCFTLFTSILDDGVARQAAGEVRRVLRPGGGLVWYDFRVGNPWNPNVRGMSRRRLRELFPGWPGTLRLVTLLPPLARRLHSLTPVLYPVLAAVPPLRTHWAGLLECPK
jgi:SAM-dependent methyltransferase